jgi:4-hydroxythreonine-4-phosphate dehydrogenase
MGEPAGIGGEIALKAWATRGSAKLSAFFVLDDPARLRRLARRLGLDVPVATIPDPEAAVATFAEALPVLPVKLVSTVRPGHPNAANGHAVVTAITKAVEFCQAGRAAAVVTNPIHKATLYEAGFRHPGHTEYLGELTNGRPVMMLVGRGLRVVPVTVHLALRDAIRALRRQDIVDIGQVVADALHTDFGIAQPRLAIAGLNPHAGEGTSLGAEDHDIIAPAIAELRQSGIAVFGPTAADSLFHAGARTQYDVALCMYHDQALIPLKTLDFMGGVNVTLGLPIVRTSPDHGTAFDLAGLGKASAQSLIAALKLAARIARNRRAAARTDK